VGDATCFSRRAFSATVGALRRRSDFLIDSSRMAYRFCRMRLLCHTLSNLAVAAKSDDHKRYNAETDSCVPSLLPRFYPMLMATVLASPSPGNVEYSAPAVLADAPIRLPWDC